MTKAVTSELLNLEIVVAKNYQFLIPSYQRPYVWDSINIEEFINHIHYSFQENESHYFIGTTLSSKLSYGENIEIFELVDGQQRTTTLLLLVLACFEFKDSDLKDHPILKVATLAGRPRLHFEIRDQVEAFLGSLAGIETYGFPSQDELSNDDYLIFINSGLKTLKQKLKKIKSDGLNINDFIDFIYKNVLWINNTIPKKTDLNKLFSSMNTTGVQLEPVDLLKANIFKKITRNKKNYDSIWDTCQNMNTYFDRVLRKKITTQSWNALTYEEIHEYNTSNIEFNLINDINQSSTSVTGLSIAEIYKKRNHQEHSFEKTTSTEDDPDEDFYCRSFINFELLLIHTLRIYYFKNGLSDIEERINTSNLQKIFRRFLENSTEADVKNFLHLLWKVRYQFDTWSVKWLENIDNFDEELQLTKATKQKSKIRTGKSYFTRSIMEQSALALLQSVRIFTGERSAQYWLTPFLYGLITANYHYGDEDKILNLLEKIDNDLSLAQETQKELSFKLCAAKNLNLKPWSEQRTYLDSSKGTSFEHYWFQKLEYVLWKNYKARKEPKFRSFRITAKNSVEHVYPQNPRNGVTLPKEFLHSFGNLVLLSPGQNSEYSNKEVRVKDAEFKGKPTYDSLKLQHLLSLMNKKQMNDLNKDLILEHKGQMLKVLTEHYY